MVDQVEEMSLESPRKMQDEQEVMRETSGYLSRGRKEDAWRLGPEGETEPLEPKVVSNGVEGVHVELNGEGHHEREQETSRRQREAPGEEGEEIESPKRKVIRVKSEEAQDVRKAGSGRNKFRTERDQRSAISAARRPSASGSLLRW